MEVYSYEFDNLEADLVTDDWNDFKGIEPLVTLVKIDDLKNNDTL